jgi:hypothetical protein
VTKLVSLTVPSLPILGSLGNIVCADPNFKVRGFRVAIRGPAVFLVSPPGWVVGHPLASFDAKGPRRVIEVPRSECVLQFECDDLESIDKLQRFDAPPMGVVEDVEDLEALTAPKAMKK